MRALRVVLLAAIASLSALPAPAATDAAGPRIAREARTPAPPLARPRLGDQAAANTIRFRRRGR